MDKQPTDGDDCSPNCFYENVWLLLFKYMQQPTVIRVVDESGELAVTVSPDK